MRVRFPLPVFEKKHYLIGGREHEMATLHNRIAPAGDDKEIFVLALIKGEERFFFLYDAAHREEMLRTLGKFASRTDMNFSWYDAAHLSSKVRAQGAGSY